MRGRPGGAGGLWRHPEFLKLWGGQTVSSLGSEVTTLAFPLTAALTLGAGPLQMGLLGVCRYAPHLVLSLVAGVWVDRLRRRPLLVACNVGRAALLASIPAAAAFSVLRMEQLYAVALATGVLTLFNDLARQAFLPEILRRDELVEGNAKLESTAALTSIAGPAAAGALVQRLTAPAAIAVDAVSFLAAALCLALIKVRPAPAAAPGTAASAVPRQTVWREVAEGVRVVAAHPVLRAFAATGAVYNLFGNILFAVYVLYATRELGLGPAALGAVFAAGSVGGLFGALLAGWATRRVGLGPATVGGVLLAAVGRVFLPFAAGPSEAVLAILIAGYAVSNFGNPIYNVNVSSLRQTITPDRLQGRVVASMRFVSAGVQPVGALLGGLLGEAVGLRPTMAIAAFGSLLAPLVLLVGHVWTLRDEPPPLADPGRAV